MTLSKGRMIPTSPWDGVFRGIASWLGIPDSAMSEIFPNLDNFLGVNISKAMFGGDPPTPSKILQITKAGSKKKLKWVFHNDYFKLVEDKEECWVVGNV